MVCHDPNIRINIQDLKNHSWFNRLVSEWPQSDLNEVKTEMN